MWQRVALLERVAGGDHVEDGDEDVDGDGDHVDRDDAEDDGDGGWQTLLRKGGWVDDNDRRAIAIKKMTRTMMKRTMR